MSDMEEKLSLPDPVNEIKMDSKAVKEIKIPVEQESMKHVLVKELTIPKADPTKEADNSKNEVEDSKKDGENSKKDGENSEKEEPRDLVKEAMGGGLVDGQSDYGGGGQTMISVVVSGSQPQDQPPLGQYHHGYSEFSGYGQNPPMAVGYDNGQVGPSMVAAGYGYQQQQPSQSAALPVGWAYSPAQGYYTNAGSHQYQGYQKSAGPVAGGSRGFAGGSLTRASSQPPTSIGERKTLKMMPSVVTRLTEKRYLILTNPAFVETEL